MNQIKGAQSISFEVSPYIMSSGSVVGSKESEGPLGKLFDVSNQDDLFGAKTWEEAESNMQKEACVLALGKAHVKPESVRFLFGGDLLRQGIATSMGVESLQIPLFGLYGACSTCGESLSLGSMAIDGGFATNVICVTSSHFASAEKEFRNPLEYGSQRPLSATWIVTGSGAFVLGREPGKHVRAVITGITTGKIIDYGLKDSMNMGCCMAPAASNVVYQNLIDFGRQPSDYDKIITGDLGSIGQRALVDLVAEKGYDISGNVLDCGMQIYDSNTQDTHAGGSGCGCAAVTLSAYILKQLEEKKWKRVLFIPTGALLSKTSFNEGKTVPGIAHGVVLESV